jgi:hypothetical protein
VAVTKNIPVLPTVTVSLAGFVVIDGGEFVGGDGFGGEGEVGSVGDDPVFAPLTIPVHPEMSKTGIRRSIWSSKISAQRGRGLGSRGQGRLINLIVKFAPRNCIREENVRQPVPILIYRNICVGNHPKY